MVATLKLQVVAHITITKLPWKNKTFENIFAEPKLAELVSATVSNVCAFIVDSHRGNLGKIV
jgi:hypothetical protein